MPPGHLKGKTAIVVDVLRASTTMTAALAAGAAGITPFASVEAAREAGPERMLTGGERQGVRVEGFDLGNSPLEYTSDTVAGHEIRFTTTNGTRAIEASRDAEALWIGSFVNASAVLEAARRSSRDIAVVCSGTERRPTLEDNLFAGLVAWELFRNGVVAGNVVAQSVAEIWSAAARAMQRGDSLFDVLLRSPWAQRLMRLDREPDIRFAAERDRFDILPRLDPQRNLIVVA